MAVFHPHRRHDGVGHADVHLDLGAPEKEEGRLDIDLGEVNLDSPSREFECLPGKLRAEFDQTDLLLGPPPLVVPSALSRRVSLSLCPLIVSMERVTVWLLSHFIREVSATLRIYLAWMEF